MIEHKFGNQKKQTKHSEASIEPQSYKCSSMVVAKIAWPVKNELE